MEDYIHKSDYERDEEIKVLFDRVEDLDGKELGAKCVYCESIIGSLVHLTNGWCCLKCFKELLNKPEVNKPSLSQENKKEDGFPPTPKGMGIQPTIL